MPSRTILAFDATCGECRPIADVVRRYCDDALDVLPLKDPDVVELLRRAGVSGEAEPKPTLLVESGSKVAARTGPAMGPALLRRLGLRSTIRVLGALGELGHYAADPVPARPAGGVGRAQFLRFALAGGVVASGIMFGQKPAFAATAQKAAADWVAANADRLPQKYDEVIRYAPNFRREIIRRLPAEARSGLWVEQLTRYQAAHPELTEAQRKAIEFTVREVAKPDTYTFGDAPRAAVEGRLAEVEAAVIAAFGKPTQELKQLFGTIGPWTADQTASLADPVVPGCCCNVGSDWNNCERYPGDCEPNGNGGCYCGVYCCDCGFLGAYSCNGFCYSTCNHTECG